MQCHFEDKDLLVLEKPADLLSVPGRGPDKQDCLLSRAWAYWPDALIVHRLDCATSGLMVLARSKAAHRALSIQFQNRQTFKRYQAMVIGSPEDKDGVLKLPLRCDWDRRPRQIVDFEQGKSATTFWQKIDTVSIDKNRCARLALYPITGRSHQLRVHMQAFGHPILGDNLYASSLGLSLMSRLCLHADLLEIQHPVSGERLSFVSPAPF